MGGFGSGRSGGWPTVEGCESLVLSVDDITRPIRDGLRRLGMQGIPKGKTVQLQPRILHWAHHGEDEPWATVEIRLELRSHDGTAWLRYEIKHCSDNTGPQNYPIAMVTTPCRFGGQRWYWICPETGRWVRKLYLPNGGRRFLSRGRYRLAYGSQRQDPLARMHARCRKLYCKLNADYNGPIVTSWPPKPKGMHWRTYAAICDKLDSEAHVMNLQFLRAAAKWRLLARP